MEEAVVSVRFLEAVETLKREVRKEVTALVSRFRAQTGVEPSGIEIVIVETTTSGDPVARFGVVNVRLTFRGL